MPNSFNDQIIEEFRANRGQVGGMFANARLLLLTTIGARTGTPHTTPLAYLPDGGGKMLVIGSAGGSSKHPDWYRNLLANPRVRVETGVLTFEAEAAVLPGEERDRVFARAVEANPGWGDYQTKTTRVIPVVALTPVAGGPDGLPPGDGLKLIHDAFRRELALVRAEVAGAGPGLGAQLRINCLAMCQGLHYHHLVEDNQMFPFLDEQHPALEQALARLRQEHQTVKGLLDDLQEQVSGDGAEPAALLAEVDRLIAKVEAHLLYEEEQLIPTLNTLVPA